MAADKATPNRRVKNHVSRDQTAISEDITRIVGYLNTKRSNASERATGLVQELSHRREDLSGRPERSVTSESSTQIDRPNEVVRVQSAPRGKSNPVLAERYHAFCHDLDVMLDGFRARVDGDKPVRH
ncbi:MAG: hypothetical protein ACI89J_002991 [Hyphomicrobiaceae bacterium]|jgi:hypothetical protein